MDTAVFACPVWLTDALPFIAADLEVWGGAVEVSRALAALVSSSHHPWTSGIYPMVGADTTLPTAWAGAEVEGRGWQAAMIQAQHVGPTGSAVLHIAQV